jgi:predicted phosphodiesterase
MRIGILADIHEHVDYLSQALELLNDDGIDQIVLLGDVALDGRNLE